MFSGETSMESRIVVPGFTTNNWPVFRTRIPNGIIFVQLAISLAPFGFSLITMVLHTINRLDVGDSSSALRAFSNSLLISMSASCVSVLAAAILLFLKRSTLEVTVFALLGLMLPGEFIGLGMDRFVALISAGNVAGLKGACFFVSMVGFSFPYVASSLMLTRFTMNSSETFVLAELTRSEWDKARTLFVAYRRDFVLAWIVGVNLIISEVSRTRVLSEDLFGLGRQFFGPLVADAFQTHGLEQVYFFLSYVMVGTVVSAMIVVNNGAVRAK
jgi:hypothetical protein